MNRIKLISIVVLLVAAGIFFFIGKSGKAPAVSPKEAEFSPKNATYYIEGKAVTLVNGIAETEAAPESAAKVTTRYFGNEVKHDLNDDGLEDVAFILTQETGGSGAFFYFVAALNTPTGYVGSQAVFLGDRIAPQTTGMEEGTTAMGSKRQNVIVVNYAVRLPD